MLFLLFFYDGIRKDCLDLNRVEYAYKVHFYFTRTALVCVINVLITFENIMKKLFILV